MNLGPVLKVKTLKLKMVDNSVLFANLLALVASLMECIEINFAILTTKISHFIQIVESFSSIRRGAKCLDVLNLVKDDFGFVRRKQVPVHTMQRRSQTFR